MQIAFKDFVPDYVNGGFFKGTSFQPLLNAVDKANLWIGDTAVKVINVETVLLPGLKEAGPQQVLTDAPDLRSNCDLSTDWLQVVRVWYAA